MLGIGLSATAIAGLLFYKWTGSLKVIAGVQASGVLKKSPDVLLAGGPLRATLSYFGLVWPALTFGVVIGSLAEAALPARWISRLLGRRGAGSILAGGAVGAPMMLCSCCVSPVSSGLYARGARLGPSLAFMMGSPGLNVAALLLTFILLPAPVPVARLAGAVLLVFGLSAAMDRVFGGIALSARAPAQAQEQDGSLTLSGFARRLGKTLLKMTVITIPLVFVGVLASSWILPWAVTFSTLGTVLAVAIIALLATLVALPTFFEIPIALMLLGLGAPVGCAVAFLLAGPIINLPSLLVVGRQA